MRKGANHGWSHFESAASASSATPAHLASCLIYKQFSVICDCRPFRAEAASGSSGGTSLPRAIISECVPVGTPGVVGDGGACWHQSGLRANFVILRRIL